MKAFKAFLSFSSFAFLFFSGLALAGQLMPIRSLEVAYLRWWLEGQEKLLMAVVIVLGLSLIPMGYFINLILIAPVRRRLRKRAMSNQWELEEEAMREWRQRKGY